MELPLQKFSIQDHVKIANSQFWRYTKKSSLKLFFSTQSNIGKIQFNSRLCSSKKKRLPEIFLQISSFFE
jgi:hypothetical protein